MRNLVGLLLIAPLLGAQDPIPAAKGTPDPRDAVVWYDVRLLDLEGQGWKDVGAPFDRLPAKAEGKVPPAVWNLSRQSAGLAVRFITDAASIQLKWSLTNANLAMPHMPATGVSGLDLYVRSSKDGRWQWAGVGQPLQKDDNRAAITVPAGKKECLLYLPLYNGVSAVEVGLPKDSFFSKALPRAATHQKPIVFYGTSITQGGCASRPGMVHTAILGRRFERPVINLGFSGSGRMDQAVVDLLAEIDAAVYVIDCLPNMQDKEIAERTGPLVQTLRKARPTTPILLVEDRTYSNAPVNDAARKRNESNRAAIRAEYDKLLRAKVPLVHYLKGDRLLGDDGEGTVDGSHPTDLGFARQADQFADALAPLLPQPSDNRSPIEGYSDQLSYVPGEDVRFFVSSSAAEFDVEIARVGAERKLVWKKEKLSGLHHPIPQDASSRGCGWPESFRVRIPDGWSSGYYTASLTARMEEGGKPSRFEVFFVVRSANPGKDTKILLQLSTNTYNAYTNWGGYSLYAYHGRHHIQGRRVSFDRPQYSQFNNWELPFVQWAEKAGYKIDYAVNSDLEFHPELLKHYKLVLSVGHDEYWSASMRDHLERFICDGGNVAFFSGNTCCWQVRSEDAGRALTCWKQSYRDDPVFPTGDYKLLSTLWSHHLVQRPENQLTGVGFLYGGYRKSHGQFMEEKAEFTVHRPDHWLFEGTSLKRGDVFGAKDNLVGYECDGCELAWKDGLPTPTHRDGTPKSFVVLATCPAKWHPDDCEWYDRWEKGRVGNSVVGTYTNGGTVVTVGTTDWSHGLRGNDPAVMRIAKNVLEKLGK
jgi:lysophospholipase L1-like esterase